MGVTKCKPQRLPDYSYKRTLLLKCEKFTMESLELARQKAKEKLDGSRFFIYTVISGSGAFRYGKDLKSSEPFSEAQTFLIPARMGEFEIAPKGNGVLVCSYV
jgi:hypothetical protein